MDCGFSRWVYTKRASNLVMCLRLRHATGCTWRMPEKWYICELRLCFSGEG